MTPILFVYLGGIVVALFAGGMAIGQEVGFRESQLVLWCVVAGVALTWPIFLIIAIGATIGERRRRRELQDSKD